MNIEYKVVVYAENVFSSLILGSAKLNAETFSIFLNKYAKEGWEVVTMEKDKRRMLLFWQREAYIVILKRNKTESQMSAFGVNKF